MQVSAEDDQNRGLSHLSLIPCCGFNSGTLLRVCDDNKTPILHIERSGREQCEFEQCLYLNLSHCVIRVVMFYRAALVYSGGCIHGCDIE